MRNGQASVAESREWSIAEDIKVEGEFGVRAKVKGEGVTCPLLA